MAEEKINGKKVTQKKIKRASTRQIKNNITATPKKITTRKVNVAPKPKVRSKTKVAPVKSKVVTATNTTPAHKTVLPTPLPIPTEIVATLPNHVKIMPHRWSLRHNFFTVIVLCVVGALAIALVAGQADVTFQLISAYDTSSSNIIKPVPTTERSFPTTAGNLIMKFPTRWQVVDASEDTIHWQLTDYPDQQITLQIDKNDADNIFTWLQQQSLTYQDAEVQTPSAAVQALRGIMVTATGDNNTAMQVVYFPHQRDLANKYIVTLSLTVPADNELLTRSQSDLGIFIDNLKLE